MRCLDGQLQHARIQPVPLARVLLNRVGGRSDGLERRAHSTLHACDRLSGQGVSASARGWPTRTHVRALTAHGPGEDAHNGGHAIGLGIADAVLEVAWQDGRRVEGGAASAGQMTDWDAFRRSNK